MMTSLIKVVSQSPEEFQGDVWHCDEHVQMWINNINEDGDNHSSSKSSVDGDYLAVPSDLDDEMEIGADARYYSQSASANSPRLSPLLPLTPLEIPAPVSPLDGGGSTGSRDNRSDYSLRDVNMKILEACKAAQPNASSQNIAELDNSNTHHQKADTGSLMSMGSSFENPSSLAAVLQPDPEEILLSLGFGGGKEVTLLDTIPARFFSETISVCGIDVEVFRKDIADYEESSPSVEANVVNLPQRFTNNSIQSSESVCSLNAENRRILFKSSHQDIPSIHLSYDADCPPSPSSTSGDLSMNRNRLATLTELSEPGSRGSSFEEELSNEVAAAFTNALNDELRSLESKTNSDPDQTTTNDEIHKDEDPPPILDTQDLENNSTSSISKMYSNLVIPAAIKRNESSKSLSSADTIVNTGPSGNDVTESITAAVFKPISDDAMDASPTPQKSIVAFEVMTTEDEKKQNSLSTAHARRTSFREDGKTFSSRIEIENELYIDVDDVSISDGPESNMKIDLVENTTCEEPPNQTNVDSLSTCNVDESSEGFTENLEPLTIDIPSDNDNNITEVTSGKNYSETQDIITVDNESRSENELLDYVSTETEKPLNDKENDLSCSTDVKENKNNDISIDENELHDDIDNTSAVDGSVDDNNEMFSLKIRRSTADETPARDLDLSRDQSVNVIRDSLHDSGTDVSNDDVKDNATTLRLIEEIKELLCSRPTSRKTSVTNSQGKKESITEEDDEIGIINEIRDILSKTYGTTTRTRKSGEHKNTLDIYKKESQNNNMNRKNSLQNESNFYQKGIEYEEKGLFCRPEVDEAIIRVDQSQSLYASNPSESFEVDRDGIDMFNGDLSESLSVEEEIRIAETMNRCENELLGSDTFGYKCTRTKNAQPLDNKDEASQGDNDELELGEKPIEKNDKLLNKSKEENEIQNQENIDSVSETPHDYFENDIHPEIIVEEEDEFQNISLDNIRQELFPANVEDPIVDNTTCINFNGVDNILSSSETDLFAKNTEIPENNNLELKHNVLDEEEEVFADEDDDKIETASIDSDDQLELCEKQYIRSNVLSLSDANFSTNNENEDIDSKGINTLDDKGILHSGFDSLPLSEQKQSSSRNSVSKISRSRSIDNLKESNTAEISRLESTSNLRYSSMDNVFQSENELHLSTGNTSSTENEELIALFRKEHSSIIEIDRDRSESLLIESISSDTEKKARFNESFRVFCSKLQEEFHKDDIQIPIVRIEEEVLEKQPSVTAPSPPLSPECISISDDGDKTHSDSNDKMDEDKEKKSTKNYLTAAFQSIAMALGKYQDSRPSKCNDELETSENDLSSGPEKSEKSEKSENVTKKNDTKQNKKTEKPKRRLFNIFNHRTATLQTNNAFPLLTANIVNGKVKTDDTESRKSGSETDLRKHAETVTLITPINHSSDCIPNSEPEIKPIEMNELQCCNENAVRTSYNDQTISRTVDQPSGGYAPDSPLSSDEQPSSSFTRKRRKRLKQLGKGVSMESSGFDEDGTKLKYSNNWYCPKCNNDPSYHSNEILNSSNETRFARELDKLMDETRAHYEDNFQKCDCGRTNYYGFVSHNHFEYVIKQLTRVRSEINTHFDLQAKRESELKLLLNNQVNEMKQIITTEHMGWILREMEYLKGKLKEKDDEIEKLRGNQQ